MAEELKNKGNIAFKSGNYAEAVDFYTKAIELDSFSAILFTNRYKKNLYILFFISFISCFDVFAELLHMPHLEIMINHWKMLKKLFLLTKNG